MVKERNGGRGGRERRKKELGERIHVEAVQFPLLSPFRCDCSSCFVDRDVIGFKKFTRRFAVASAIMPR